MTNETIPVTPVTGYRSVTREQLELVEEGKKLALEVGVYIEKLERLRPERSAPGETPLDDPDKNTEGRWVAIGKTQLQQGFMALFRSVFRPEGF